MPRRPIIASVTALATSSRSRRRAPAPRWKAPVSLSPPTPPEATPRGQRQASTRLGAIEVNSDAVADYDAEHDRAAEPGPAYRGRNDLQPPGATRCRGSCPSRRACEAVVGLPAAVQDIGASPVPRSMTPAIVTDDTIGELVVDLRLQRPAPDFDEFTDHFGRPSPSSSSTSSPFIQGRPLGGGVRSTAASVASARARRGPGRSGLLGRLAVELSLDEVRACQILRSPSMQTMALLAHAGEEPVEVPATQVAMHLP